MCLFILLVLFSLCCLYWLFFCLVDWVYCVLFAFALSGYGVCVLRLADVRDRPSRWCHMKQRYRDMYLKLPFNCRNQIPYSENFWESWSMYVLGKLKSSARSPDFAQIGQVKTSQCSGGICSGPSYWWLLGLLSQFFLRVFEYTSQATRRNARVFVVYSCCVSVRFGQRSVLAFWDLNRCSGYFGTVHCEKPRCPTKKNTCYSESLCSTGGNNTFNGNHYAGCWGCW